jgi:PAS domain S-box-containing protein
MSTTTGTVLIVEDDEGLALLQKKRIERAGFSVAVAHSIDEALAVIQHIAIDLVLLDYQLPGGKTGLDLQADFVKLGFDLPVIVVTGFHDEATVIKALRAGVRDFVTKSALYLDYLVEVIDRVLRQVRMERRLEVSQALLSGVVASNIDAIISLDADGHIALFNPAAERLFGIESDAAMGQPLSAFVATDDSTVPRHPGNLRAEVSGTDCDGRSIPLEASISNGRVGNRQFQTWVLRDLREQKAMQANLLEIEQRLRQKQKLEAVGALAGGVAHEFNNLLQAILGYTKYAMAGLVPEAQAHQDLQQVIKASDRAVVLTRQLLTFSRRKESQRQKVSIDDCIQELEKLLRPLLGELVELTSDCADEPAFVLVDPHEFQQALLNLCINARDAMPDGGRLAISSRNVQLNALDCKRLPGLSPGYHCVVAITDTGCGMPLEIQERIFEPFFTTKVVGQGTGLGLAMVHGMVTQSQGAIHVYSEVGAGTTFRIYLPLPDDIAPAPAESHAEIAEIGGSETILVAEDEPLVRDLAGLILRDAGYTVLCSTDGEDALRVFLENAQSIDLILADVMMPKMTGIQLRRRLVEMDVNVPVVFCSGHAPKSMALELIHEQRYPLVQKPYSAAELLTTVRAALDDSRRRPSTAAPNGTRHVPIEAISAQSANPMLSAM